MGSDATLTRRYFLRLTAMMAVSAIAASCAPPQPPGDEPPPFAIVEEPAVELLDVEEIVLDAFRAEAAAARVDWHLVEAADGDRSGPDWPRLQRLASRCRPRIADGLSTPGQTPLLIYADILVRYGLKDVLADLHAAIGTATGPHGVWLLVSGSHQPLLDGQATGVPSQTAIVSESWVRNAHRSEIAASAR